MRSSLRIDRHADMSCPLPLRLWRCSSSAQSEDAEAGQLLTPLPAAGLVAISTSAAGQALAETVTPSGSGIPVAGGAISVDGAVNQLVEAIKVGTAHMPATWPCSASFSARRLCNDI